MPGSSIKSADTDRPDQGPVAWFATLVIANNRGDYQTALEAQRELSRLGWFVVRKLPRRQGGGQ
jgi:hypothetical protein